MLCSRKVATKGGRGIKFFPEFLCSLKSHGGVVKTYLTAMFSAKLTPPDQVYL